jgi:hypothetical protein
MEQKFTEQAYGKQTDITFKRKKKRLEDVIL